MSTEEEKKFRVDDVLSQFRIFGPYHRRLMVLFTVANIYSCAHMTNYIFAVEEVKYRCKDNNVNDTCGANSTSCSEWVYDVPNSFVAEFQLACQDWKRTLVGTVRSFAYMVGLLIVGPLSDRIGRKSIIVVTGMIGAILGLSKSFVTWYWLYIALEFLEAAFGDTYSPIYILNLEIISTSKRVVFSTICGLGYSIGGVMQALTAYLANDWRLYIRVLYAPLLLYITFIYIIDESPRWLLIKGKRDKAVAVLNKMAKRNKTKIDCDVLDGLISDHDKEENVEFTSVLKSTFASRTLFKRFIVCVVWWVTSTFVNYGMTISSVSLQGNKYVNYVLVALTDVPGSLLVIFVVSKFNRKKPLIVSFFIAGAFCIGQPFIPTHYPWVSILMYMTSKIMVSLYFGITYIYTSEIFPTYTRNSMVALCSSIGRIGSTLAPQMPLLTVYWEGLPSLLYGIASINAGLLTLLVPDVSNDALPDTVKQAEHIGLRSTHDENDKEWT